MPLAAAGVWFDSDAGDVRVPRPTLRRPETGHWLELAPVAIYFMDEPLWAMHAHGRRQPRPWEETTEHVTQPYPVLRVDWLDTSVAARRGQWRPAESPHGLVPTPSGVTAEQTVSWHGPEASRPRKRVFRAGDGQAEPLAYGGGQIIAALGWCGDSGAGRMRVSPSLHISAPHESPTVAVPFQEQALGLFGWQGNDRSVRRAGWRFSVEASLTVFLASGIDPALLLRQSEDRPARRAAWHASVETVAAVPLSWTGGIEAALVGWQTAPMESRRGRARRVSAAESEASLIFTALAAAYLPFLVGQSERQLNTRARRAATPTDDAPQDRLAHQISIGSRWTPGLDAQMAPIRSRRGVMGIPITRTPDAGQAVDVPWLPVDDGGRAQMQRPAWRPFTPEWAAPAWIEAGAIIVAGPFYCAAAGVFQAGAVEGDAETLS